MQDNDRVRFWDYTWVPGAAVPRHVHDTDTVEVFVDGGSIESTAADGKSTQFQAAWKSARFVPRGTIDSEAATTGSPRAVVVELK